MFQIENWIRTAEFRKKIPIRSEDMDKIQTEFPRSMQYFHEVECTPHSLFPPLSYFVKLRSSCNAWTSYVMPLCGTIYNEICR